MVTLCYDDNNLLRFSTQKFNSGKYSIEVTTYPPDMQDSTFYLNNKLIKVISLSGKNYSTSEYSYNDNWDLVSRKDQFFYYDILE